MAWLGMHGLGVLFLQLVYIETLHEKSLLNRYCMITLMSVILLQESLGKGRRNEKQ